MQFCELNQLSIDNNRLGIPHKIKRFLHIVRYVNPFSTLMFNFVNFPISIAFLLPVLLGWRVQIIGLRRKCILIDTNKRIRTGMIELGITRFPIMSTKGQYTLIRIGEKSCIELGDNVRIHNGCSLIASSGGVIHIGDDFIMNQRARIYACNSVRFGDHCRIGWESQMMDSDFHYILDENKHLIPNNNKPIIIGNNCWIANRVSLMKGSILPDYSIVSGGSIYNKDYSGIKTKGNFFAGIPAVLKGTGIYRIFDKKLEGLVRKSFIPIGPYESVNIPKDYNFINILD